MTMGRPWIDPERAGGRRRFAWLFAVVAAVLLTAGTVPRDVRAGVCGNLNEGPGCVGPKDVGKNAVRARNRLDEAGTEFVAIADAQMAIGIGPKVYATVVVDAPAAGTVIVNASITLQALENPGPGTGPGVKDGRGTVLCALTGGGNVIAQSNRSRFFGSVDWDDDIEFDSMAITRGFSVSRKTSSTIALSCQVIAVLGGGAPDGTLLRVRAPSISAAYYSNLSN